MPSRNVYPHGTLVSAPTLQKHSQRSRVDSHIFLTRQENFYANFFKICQVLQLMSCVSPSMGHCFQFVIDEYIDTKYPFISSSLFHPLIRLTFSGPIRLLVLLTCWRGVSQLMRTLECFYWIERDSSEEAARLTQLATNNHFLAKTSLKQVFGMAAVYCEPANIIVNFQSIFCSGNSGDTLKEWMSMFL